ncbi:hypothetical protein J2W91_004569 [Paenibacillus amylolyticus]|uniref:Uncharacterized protein n=1 Tax=Paenibacillus amylolyticus TaxID=1451 RepID=A0AAP5LQZ5_PAEAM|nr:hypothetical protein [Paenibacillus amylolyticus]MDR6726063.1 hypothetical protein [Paenibacillus amylolyticus]
MLLTKTTMISQAIECGIHLTPKLLDRYLELGFLNGSWTGDGRGKGARKYFNHADLDTIQHINQLKQEGISKNQKDLIFVLFWGGYDVDWEKLKIRLLSFYEDVQTAFNEITKYSQDNSYGDFIDLIASQDLRKRSKTGRPSNSEQKEFQDEHAATVEMLWDGSNLARALSDRNISMEHIEQLSRSKGIMFQDEIDGMPMSEIIQSTVNGWLQRMDWKKQILNTNEEDFRESYSIIHMMRTAGASLGDFGIQWPSNSGNYKLNMSRIILLLLICNIEMRSGIKWFVNNHWSEIVCDYSLVITKGGDRK